jgi:hypothetical protein
MIPDEHSPDSAVSLLGIGTRTPAIVTRRALRHHPVTIRNPISAATAAIVDGGRISRLPTGVAPVSRYGFDRALVSALYGT